MLLQRQLSTLSPLIEPIAHIIINNMHIVVYNVGTETSLCINVRFLQKYIDVYCVRLL